MNHYNNGTGHVPRLPDRVVDTLIDSAGVSRLAPHIGSSVRDQTAQVERLVHETCEELLARLPASPVQGAASASGATPADFDASWAREIANNGGVQIGADYREWMLKGWRAASASGAKGAAVKTWRQRVADTYGEGLSERSQRDVGWDYAMAEIADWRALAERSQSQPSGAVAAAFKELVGKNTHRRPRIVGNDVEYRNEIDTYQIGRDVIDIAYGKANSATPAPEQEAAPKCACGTHTKAACDFAGSCRPPKQTPAPRSVVFNIPEMVNRFLRWPLPELVSIRLVPNIDRPIGTHLLSADEAKEMLEYVLGTNGEAFCDSHCTWLNHHPECILAAPVAQEAEQPKGEVILECRKCGANRMADPCGKPNDCGMIATAFLGAANTNKGGEVVNHAEAYELACIKRDKSNLARCYLDLRAAVSARSGGESE